MKAMPNRQGSFTHRDFLIEAWVVVLAAGFARALSDIALERDRALAAPAASCAAKKAHELVTTGPPKHSGLPCATVLTLIFVLSPVSVTS
jgi:hypothetical protein